MRYVVRVCEWANGVLFDGVNGIYFGCEERKYLHIVLLGGGQRHRVEVLGDVVSQGHARRRLEHRPGRREVDGPLRLDGDGLGLKKETRVSKSWLPD